MATCVGMIVPPAAGEVPPEPLQLYPEMDFLAEGLGLPKLSPEGYDSVIDLAASLAQRLQQRGAEAISLMGTSLSFYRGPAGNQQVLDAMRAATGLPVTTMTDSVMQALSAVGGQRIAVATAYDDRVNRPLIDYLTGAGFEVLALEALHLTAIADIHAVTDDDLLTIGAKAIQAAPDADCLFISCGGLRTLTVIPPLEAQFDLPVISSATAGAWGAARLVGHSGRAKGFGRLFSV